jgi:hypothetical protein
MPDLRILPGLVILAALVASGCTTVQQQETYAGSLPRPEQIIVFDFAVTPDEVKVDSGLSAKAVRSVTDDTVEEKQVADAHKVARVLAKKLVQEISDMGLPVVHEQDPPIEKSAVNLLVRGSFVSVDEGDRGERVAIGLGAGRSSVVIEVELVDWVTDGERVVDRFKVAAKSARNPGAAETMGAGAVAGHLLLSTAVTAGAQTASETFGSGIDDDTRRAAKQTAALMKKFFVRQGWIDD